MTYTYLTLDSIEEAFTKGGITLMEANELLQQLERFILITTLKGTLFIFYGGTF